MQNCYFSKVFGYYISTTLFIYAFYMVTILAIILIRDSICTLCNYFCLTRTINPKYHSNHAITYVSMWQSHVEIENYFAMSFDHIATFKALLKDSVMYRVGILLYIEKSALHIWRVQWCISILRPVLTKFRVQNSQKGYL